MFRAVQFVICSLVVLAACTVVQAEAIPLMSNVTTGAVILDDGFETRTVGVKPGAPWSGGLYNTGPGNTDAEVVVGDFASEGVAAYEGDNFLKLRRGAGYAGAYLEGVGTAANSGIDNTIKLELAYRITGTEVSLYAMSNGGAVAQFGLWANGDVGIVTPDAQNWTMFTEKANVGEWNKLVIMHTNRVDAWSVSINDVAFGVQPGFTGTSALPFTGITFQTDAPSSTGYFDAVPVPEPSVIASLVSGIIGLLAYAWRKRK